MLGSTALFSYVMQYTVLYNSSYHVFMHTGPPDRRCHMVGSTALFSYVMHIFLLYNNHLLKSLLL